VNRIDSEQGSASVLVLAICAVLMLMFSTMSMGVRLAREYRVVQQAADLSALAAALVTLDNTSSPCQIAEEIARRNQTNIKSCVVRMDQVEVVVQSPELTLVSAKARAGIF
jgi:secretion/DNA translocation related TadE-like protein